ncbi:hypothetical protein L0666_08175 [Octadecabacter sp. CECT 8868]|uniref:hypothetical protein n=1 Tax=Octadecabacter algicola TaxID=2909342 RepID=UPI001F352ECF|nr:hypothetical protein [Octadecabacter algicola]MCF2904962.1 hypothetical protein [Octadecabacter algicola]
MTKIWDRARALATKSVAAPLWLASLVIVPETVAADLADIQWSSTLSFDREMQMTWDEGTLNTEFAAAPSFLTTAKTSTSLPNGAHLSFGADVLLTGNGVATTNGETELEGGLSFNYRQKFGTNNDWQYQVRGESDILMSNEELVFQRQRLGFHLKYRLSPEHSTAGFVRFGYRDQNDDRLLGYDQTEFLGSLTHTWRPEDSDLTFAGTVYTETRRADYAQYSYDEVGLRFMARTPLSETNEMTARLSIYQREFQDGYSATNPTHRDDTRIKLSVEVEHTFSDQLSGSAYAGWDGNGSTISGLSYDGPIAGVAITYQWQ